MHRKGEFPMRYQAAIFDMDGTILNTVEDLTSSLNYALLKTGHRSDFVPDDVRLFFGSGVFVAARRALWCERTGKILLDVPEDAKITEEAHRIEEVFRGYYVDHCAEKTGPYPGILRSSKSSGRQGFPPPSSPTNRTMRSKSLQTTTSRDFSTLPSGRCRGCAKASPDTVWKVCGALHTDPADAVYIGDSEVDIETTKNAGTAMISVDWGFRSRDYLAGLHPLSSSPAQRSLKGRSLEMPGADPHCCGRYPFRASACRRSCSDSWKAAGRWLSPTLFLSSPSS